ncbi:hypothetical protein ElyMa_006516700 [Elysia marginata]|uniref:Endonuclease/exonuclease/phosphatase domain-containing protein n=1 Tax=Elysia marginata TaxID=1093978 RepID=A0AAV4I6W3_9GAST|nr:hypothetical protein ElyMa_006516700 [Elysia marginata]
MDHTQSKLTFNVYIESRVIRQSFTWESNHYTILNVYSPTKTDERHAFLDTMDEIISMSEPENPIVCGDFNLVLNNDLDIIASATTDVQRVSNFLETWGLFDCLRAMHADPKRIYMGKKQSVYRQTSRLHPL